MKTREDNRTTIIKKYSKKNTLDSNLQKLDSLAVWLADARNVRHHGQ